MGKGFQGAVLRGLGAQEHCVTVTGTQKLADHFIRVHCHSETLLNTQGEAPANWIRAWFPDPDGGSRQHQRGYTIVDPDPQTGRFAMDFVIHHPMGPASYWAANCDEGQQIVAMRYGEHPFALPTPAPEGYLLMGDLAGYPAIRALAEAIPKDQPVVVYLERHTELDNQLPLPQGPNITAAWVDELPDGQALVQALAGRDWTGWYAWVTGESTSTRHAKTLLQREYGLNRATLHAQAYWIRGRAMGKSETLDTLNAAAEHEGRAVAEQAAPAATPAGSTPEEPARQPAAGVLAAAKIPLIAAGVAQALISILQLVPFVLFAELARSFLTGAQREEYVSTAVTAAVVMGLTTAAASLLVLVLHFYDASFSAALRRRLMSKLSVLPLGWFGDRRPGEVKKLVSDDVGALHYLITHTVPDVVGGVVTPLATLIYLFTVQWRLGLVLLVPLAAYLMIMSGIARADRERMVRSQRYLALAAGQAQTFIMTRDVAAVYGPQAVVDLPATLGEVGDFIADWQRDTGPRKILASMSNRPTTVLGILLVAGYLFIMPGWIEPLDLLPFLVLGTAMGGQLISLALNLGALIAALNSRSGIELFLATPELAPPADRSAPAGHVRFEDVSFAYGTGRTVLEGLSLELQRGTVTALVGPSGAGKSTVAALLARLWDVERGTVSIDGTDVRDLTHEQLYARVSILLQDVQLIHGSVRDNIALTRPEASQEEIHKAAQAAHLDAVVADLPQGYDTIISTDRLSGGERQRVGIARALLADTPIVVLDEATAAADAESEWAIRKGFEHLLAGRTVLMIAHRLHTITNADQIVVMDAGQVVQTGTHAELSSVDGLYRRLWDAGESSFLEREEVH
ncbi:ABC transporter ATP-binding protein/permease [Gephyromycinifex aptenodytis]|uniref:ABC transporter ATP-binding protein/permease n=1 Tax=Gephyromycinifex aptenodytis TaxID=2716227 RepID=UPI0014462B51|nr:ABC transporter ATP-binding protein/permease [Gephyromycinifex aptenodytis]